LEEEFRNEIAHLAKNEVASMTKGLIYRALFGVNSANTAQFSGNLSGNKVLTEKLLERFCSVKVLSDRQAIEAGLTLLSTKNRVIKPIFSGIVQSLVADGACIFAGRDSLGCTKVVAQLLAGGAYCDIHMRSDFFSFEDICASPVTIYSPDFVSTMLFSDYLIESQSKGIPTVLRINGFNLIPPESYLRRFMSVFGAEGIGRCLVWRGSAGIESVQVRCPIYTILDSACGASMHPIGPDINEFLSVFLVDELWDRDADDIDLNVNVGFQIDRDLLGLGTAKRLDRVFDIEDVETKAVLFMSKVLGRKNATPENLIAGESPSISRYLRTAKERHIAGYFGALFN
jgi:hypothetical protein